MSYKTAAALEKEFNDLIISSFQGLDRYPQDPAELAKIERAEIRMKAAQMRERIQRRLVPDELESLVREVQTDIIKARIVLPGETLLEKSERVMRELGLDIEYTGEHHSAEALETAYNKLVVESDKLGAPEERAVFEEAERGALKDIEVDRSFYRSPAVEARIAHDTELAMKGLRESTSKSSGFGFEPQKSTVKTYTDDMGVKINSDFRPPQYDLFMEGGAEIEMQTIPSKLGGPWMSPHNVETTPYKWLSPSEIQCRPWRTKPTNILSRWCQTTRLTRRSTPSRLSSRRSRRRLSRRVAPARATRLCCPRRAPSSRAHAYSCRAATTTNWPTAR